MKLERGRGCHCFRWFYPRRDHWLLLYRAPLKHCESEGRKNNLSRAVGQTLSTSLSANPWQTPDTRRICEQVFLMYINKNLGVKPTFSCPGRGHDGTSICGVCGNKQLNLTDDFGRATTAAAVIYSLSQIYWLHGHMGFDQNKLLVLTQTLQTFRYITQQAWLCYRSPHTHTHTTYSD